MGDSVSYREYRDADFPALRELLISIWGDAAFMPKKLICGMAEVDLRDCLSRSGFTRVAVLQGEPVGLILGGVTEAPANLRRAKELAKAKHSLKRQPGGRLMLWANEKYENLCRELAHTDEDPYPAELVLFVLREDCRGFGIGWRLCADFEQDLKQKGIHRYFVSTDTMSNYGFYEHFGMRRAAVRHCGPGKFPKACMEFYIYDKQL